MSSQGISWYEIMDFNHIHTHTHTHTVIHIHTHIYTQQTYKYILRESQGIYQYLSVNLNTATNYNDPQAI